MKYFSPTYRLTYWRLQGLFVLLMLMCCFVFADAVFAQAAHPFATPEQRLVVPTTGWFAEFSGQMAAWQGHFYRQLTGAVRAWKQDGWAAWLLLALSFGYGVFHALGPGHGKAVLTAYVLANRETIRNGALLAMLSAFLQAFVAIALVAIAAGILQVSGMAMNRATWWLELASYAMMAALGAWLVYKHVLKPCIHWIQGQMKGGQGRHSHAAHPIHSDHACSHDHGHDHGHAHHHHHHHAPSAPAHVHDESCGHVHMPDPNLIAGPLNWTKAISAVLAVGLRPCSGAVFVLVFSLAQGFFIAGIAAALAMGLGTGLTVAALASASLWVSQVTVSATGGTQRIWGKVFLAGLQALASFAVLALGLLLLSAAIGTGTTAN
jgi:ABC-type nickel/cobalt efflux system permease component RcnA